MTLGFGTLAVVVLAGLAGPLLGALGSRLFLPVVLGELLAGILVGPAVLGAVDPTQPTIAVLGEIGFAMLMLTVGMHLPLRERGLGGSVRIGAKVAGVVCLLAVPAGLLAATVAGGGHAAIYAVVLASGSAAVLLPAIEEAGLRGPVVTAVMAQVAIADVITIVSVPIVLEPSRVGSAVRGGLLVAGAGALLLVLAQRLAGSASVQRVRHLSKRRHWALDLRVSLLALFLLGWLAQQSGTSVLLAGFAAGIVVALIGGPKRLSAQVRGIAEGFFVPLYFVVLGARLDVGGLFGQPKALALLGALLVLNLAVHLLAGALWRRPPATAVAACAQLGVPAAVASLGLTEHVLDSVTATAIVTSALLSVAIGAVGVGRLAGLAPPAQNPPAKPA